MFRQASLLSKNGIKCFLQMEQFSDQLSQIGAYSLSSPSPLLLPCRDDLVQGGDILPTLAGRLERCSSGSCILLFSTWAIQLLFLHYLLHYSFPPFFVFLNSQFFSADSSSLCSNFWAGPRSKSRKRWGLLDHLTYL